MSALEDYKEAYNKFVTTIANLHNVNVLYSSQPSVRNGYQLRKILRELRVIEKNLWSTSVLASKEVAKARGRGRPKKEK